MGKQSEATPFGDGENVHLAKSWNWIDPMAEKSRRRPAARHTERTRWRSLTLSPPSASRRPPPPASASRSPWRRSRCPPPASARPAARFSRWRRSRTRRLARFWCVTAPARTLMRDTRRVRRRIFPRDVLRERERAIPRLVRGRMVFRARIDGTRGEPKPWGFFSHSPEIRGERVHPPPAPRPRTSI